MQRSRFRELRSFLREGVREIPLARIIANEPFTLGAGGDGSAGAEASWETEEESLQALAVSLSRFGMLHPLTVRRAAEGFELVCGFRRLAAARRCGFRTAPCLVLELSDADVRAVHLAENLRRRPADFLETASELKDLIYEFGFSIGEAALCAGLSEDEAAKLLHTLRLPTPLLAAIRKAGLTQRHALALLRIPQEPLQEIAFCEMAYNHMTPDAAERYVDRLLQGEESEPCRGNGKTTFVMKDVRLFLNSVSHGLDIMRSSGVPAECVREDADNCIKLTIRIPDTSPKRETA